MEQASVPAASDENLSLCDPVLRVKSKSINLPQHETVSNVNGIGALNVQPSLGSISEPSRKQTIENESIDGVQSEQKTNLTCGNLQKTENTVRSEEADNTVDVFVGSPNTVHENGKHSRNEAEPPVKPQLQNIVNTDVPHGSRTSPPFLGFNLNLQMNDKGLASPDEAPWDEEEGREYVPLKLNLAIALKRLLLGSECKAFSQQWLDQSFVASSDPKLCYGFLQNKVTRDLVC